MRAPSTAAWRSFHTDDGTSGIDPSQVEKGDVPCDFAEVGELHMIIRKTSNGSQSNGFTIVGRAFISSDTRGRPLKPENCFENENTPGESHSF